MSLNIIVKGGSTKRSQSETIRDMERQNAEAVIREKSTYKERQRDVARLAQSHRGQKLKNMKPTASIDARTFLRWEQQDKGFWNDKASRDKFLKDNPECRIQPD
jgi:transposase